MKKVNNIYISYWFKELDYNPSDKVNELEEEIRSVIDSPLMYNPDLKPHSNISIPRIQGMSSDKKSFFTMSSVNAFLSININDKLDIDEVVLLINNNIQLFYDILNSIYDIHILYSSIKIELITTGAKEKLISNLKLSPMNYEDISFKRGIIKDDYYINYIFNYTKEYNFNLVNKSEEVNEQDLFDRSMITSISEAKLNKEFLLTVIEVNDRYAYNVDKNHETSKDDLRGLIMEIKDILKNELYNKI